MSSSESDVSWETLRRIVRPWAGNSAELAEVTHLHGGSVSDTLGILLKDGTRCVLKYCPHRVDRNVTREAQQLAHLRLLGIPVPSVYKFQLADLDYPDSWLLMEWVDGVDLAEARQRCTDHEYERLQHELAEVVLKMHEHTGPAYMRVGTDDVECANWPQFFVDVYAPMWAELDKNPATSKACRKNFLKVQESLPRLLANDDSPRLVHWDLWAGNVIVKKSDHGWNISAVLDPMCKYAHAEAELAYLEMFQTVTRAFLDAYKAVMRPVEAYARFRRQIYQLYFLMDHAAFFGGSYHDKFAAAAEKAALIV